MQINELKAEVAKFATIRDTLAYSADVLRDVTAHQKCGAAHPCQPATVANLRVWLEATDCPSIVK